VTGAQADDGRQPDAPEATPTLSVVIPAHDAAATLPAQLDALIAQTWAEPWEIVVVDNRSSDDTSRVAESYATRAPRIRLVRADARAGVAYCRNVGVQAARAEAIAMCDADDVVAPGWVEAMGRALAEHELVTGPLDVETLNPEWVAGTRGMAIADGPGDFGGIVFAHSCNLGLRRGLADRCGPFDESLPAGEDIDWSFRAGRSGAPVTYVDGARVRYRYRTTPAGLWRQARTYGRIRPRLVRRFRAAGAAPAPAPAWRGWLWMLRNLGQLRTRAGRARWIWVAGGQVGRLEATLRLPGTRDAR
jgi:glycosyltransferase involved in cell wall biosynthesis